MKLSHFAGLVLLFVCISTTWECGDPPSSAPLYTGDLRISATYKAPLDSISVVLDYAALGKRPNPCTITGLAIGTHRLLVSGNGLAGSQAMVQIQRDRRSDVSFTLRDNGPYVEDIAPEFSVKGTRGDSLSLQQLRGKVVLLVFFEHT